MAVGVILAALATAGGVVMRRRMRGGPAPLGRLLEGLVGPHTAALAVQAERARFAPDPGVPAARPRIRIARALARDLGPMRALMVLVAPAATRPTTRRPG